MRGPTRTLLSRLSAVAAVTLLLLGCGSEDEDDGGASSPLEDPAATEASPEAAVPEPDPGELAEDDERAVRAAANDYVRAVNAHDGVAVCELLAPGALDGVRLPESGPDCASSLQHSIGFEGPGGTPVWKRTRIHELTAVSVDEGSARVTATVSHDFADRAQPSVEEDVIYLERSGEGWVVSKASATLYRAIGYPEPPLESLTPP